MQTSPQASYAVLGRPSEQDYCGVRRETDGLGDVVAEKLPGPRLIKLFRSSVYKDTNIEPSMYLGAIAELLAGTIFCSFCITGVYDLVTGGTMLTDNPIHNMVGYNNPCAFWDQPPAIYFAFMAFCPMVYLAIRYAHLDSMRADLTFAGQRQIGNAIINWIYAFSQCLVMGIFVVPPLVAKHENPTQEQIDNMHHHMRLHSAFFLQLVPCLCLAIVANYVEGLRSGKDLSTKQKVIVAYYIVTTILETVCASYCIFGYKGRYLKDEPQYYQLPPWFMQIIDYSWFISLPLVTIFSPPAPNLVIHYELCKNDPARPSWGGSIPAVVGQQSEGQEDNEQA